MFRLPGFILLALFAVNTVNGENFVTKIRNDAEAAVGIVEKEVSEAKHALRSAIYEFVSKKAELSDKTGRIHALYDRATNLVDETPEECHGDIKKNLMVLRSSGVGSFFTCSKLLEAGEDVADILIATGDLAMDVADIGRDFFAGFSGCLSSFWPWKIIGCWWDRMKTTYDDVKKTIYDIKHYASSVEGYAHNASVLLKYCWNGNTVETDVLQAMTPIHQCAKQPVPYEQYKL